MDNDSPAAPAQRSPWLVLTLSAGLPLLAGIIYWFVGHALFSHPGGSLAVSPWRDFAAELGVCGYSLTTSPVPTIFSALLLIQNRRLLPLAYTAVAIAAVELLTTFYSFFLAGATRYTPSSDLLNILFTTINVASTACLIVALLLLPVLRPRHARIRLLAVGAVLLVLFLYPLTTFNAQVFASALLNDVCLALQLFAIAVLLCLLPAVAYLNLRHPISSSQLSVCDVAPTLSLTCPRCNATQTLPSTGGGCENCRLRISIVLTESACARCGYHLRGITSDRCPECGSRISATPQAPAGSLLA